MQTAKARGEEFERTLVRFATERLLYRLGASPARDRCILKGASLLAVWLPDPYRATRDVDVLISGQTDDDAIRSLVEEICAVACPEDALRFDLSELAVEAIRPEEEYSGKRARFRAYLGNARIAVQLDLGVGDALTAQPEEIVYPTILGMMPPPRLRAYSRDTTVAEKFEAMVKLDTRNSRMKDFHDVWALTDAFEFDGRSLQKAILACFERRRTPWTGEVPRADRGILSGARTRGPLEILCRGGRRARSAAHTVPYHRGADHPLPRSRAKQHCRPRDVRKRLEPRGAMVSRGKRSVTPDTPCGSRG